MTILLYILLLIFILMPKHIRKKLILTFGNWSYLGTFFIYIILDTVIYFATNFSYAFFALLIMIIAYVVDYQQIKRILATQTNSAKTVAKFNTHKKHIPAKDKSK